jgi:hypothetical protein
MKFNSTFIKNILYNFVKQNQSTFYFKLKRKYKRVFNKINTFYGNSCVEKIYNIINPNQNKCIICNNDTMFDGFSKGYRKTCCYKCNAKLKQKKSREIRKCVICDREFETLIKRKKSCCSDACFSKFIQSDAVKNKRKQSNIDYNLKTYGKKYFVQTDDFIKKLKNTKLNRYGNENYVNVEKAKKTNLKKYGVDNPLKNDIIKQKIKNTNFKKYKTSNFSKTKEFKQVHFKKVLQRLMEIDNITPLFDFDTYDGVKNKKYKFKCKSCNSIFERNIDNGSYPICYCSNKHYENEIIEYIKSITDENIIIHDRTILCPKELDIYIPTKKIAIEFNGNYWHSETVGGKDKNYHLNKTELCNQKNIRLIHIFEDEWISKKEIVKNKLKHILNKNTEKIYARKCEIKEVSSNIKNIFLENHHIQGQDKSKIKLGLFYNNELISVMTFGCMRISLGNKHIDNEFELIRYASSIQCVGGASKLLNYFIKIYNPKKITSYADLRFSDGNLYKKLGFNLIKITSPNYWYFNLNQKNKKREHRFKYRKQELPKLLNYYDDNLTEYQNMLNNGYDRIWDCGNLKFELIIKK